MAPLKHVAAVFLAVVLLFIPHQYAYAQEAVDDDAVAWAYGTIVDSITVSGNKNTKSYVVLREMETRVGRVLEEKLLKRDLRFIGDFSPFETVTATADSLSPGHTALRIHVSERSNIFVKLILPFVRYNFESGFSYGLRWNNKNFRGRLEQLTLTYQRNERNDEEISLSWSTPWVGWRHISIGGRAAYFARGDDPVDVTVLESTSYSFALGLPLTDSRIAFSQLQGAISVDDSRIGAIGEPTVNQLSLSPTIGYRFDSRDSQLRPTGGQLFFLGLGATQPLDGERASYYRVINEVRGFHPASKKSVYGLLSNVVYQFGDFPDYSLLQLGGPTSLRGHPRGRFKGFHRWYQSFEWRYALFPKTVYPVPVIPFVDTFDFGMHTVVFVDAGIVWDDAASFELNRFHGTGGFGLRFFSPIRDVFRVDFGFNARGEGRVHLGTGARF